MNPECSFAAAMERDDEIVVDKEIREVGMERADEMAVNKEILEEEDDDDNDEDEAGDGGGDEEEDDMEDEEEYTFKFKAGENPFDFVEETDFGVQPYKKFERLEYEALAEKKRKSLADGQG